MSLNINNNTTNPEAQRRQLIRYIAAAISAVIAIMYFLIGFRVVTVLDTPSDQTFGIAAAGMYVLGTVLLLAFDRRILWIFGFALQVMVIYTYFNVASMRVPSYEVWGILIRVAQVLLIIPLLYLAARPSIEEDAARNNWKENVR